MRNVKSLVFVCLFAIILGLRSYGKKFIKDWSDVTIEDMGNLCLNTDDDAELEKLIEIGLPVDNYFDFAGNSKRLRPFTRSDLFKSRTLLLEALHKNAQKCFNLLLSKNADISKIDAEENNAFIMAAYLSENKVCAIASKIRELTAFDLDERNIYNESALGTAVRLNNGAYVKWLIANGADINATDGFSYNGKETGKIYKGLGEYPVLFHAANARNDIYKLFMDHPQINFSLLNFRGKSVLQQLNPVNTEYEERFKYLHSKGASLKKQWRNSLGCLEWNMMKLGDCAERVEMICAQNIPLEDLEEALKYAEKKNCPMCRDVIMSFIKKCREGDGDGGFCKFP